MTRDKLLASIAAIITTLAEVDGAPESMLYLALGSDMTVWTDVKVIMLGSSLISIDGHYVTLTDKGRELAGKINAKLASH